MQTLPPEPASVREGFENGAIEVVRSWRTPLVPWVILLGVVPWSVWIFSLVPLDRDHLRSGAIPLAIVALGILALVYWAVAHLVNRTRFRIEGGVLTVRHGPLPWWGARTLPLSGITDVVARTRQVRTKVTWVERSDVLALNEEGVGIPIVEDLREESEAEGIAARLRPHVRREKRP